MAKQVPVDLKKWMTKVLTHFCLFLGKSGSSDKLHIASGMNASTFMLYKNLFGLNVDPQKHN